MKELRLKKHSVEYPSEDKNVEIEPPEQEEGDWQKNEILYHTMGSSKIEIYILWEKIPYTSPKPTDTDSVRKFDLESDDIEGSEPEVPF